ncbi:MAG TPA: hypothetical protein VKG85_04985 [Actinomycetes bacterium]|nr:hypothetical protein [Actinomycetes bacterium]
MSGAAFAPAVPLRLVRRAAIVGAAALLLAGCDGDGLDGVGTRTPSPSIALPTASVPSPTRSPIRTETPTPSEEPSEAPSPTATRTRPATPTTTEAPTQTPSPTTTRPATPTTTAAPTPTVTRTVTESPSPTPTPTESPTPTATQTESPTPSPSPSPSAEAAATDGSGTPAWLWWLLAAVAVGLAIGIPLLLRSRRRQAWQRDFAAAEGEVAWFARMLIPELRRAGSIDRAAGGWAVASSRVTALEDQLVGLETAAPDEAARSRARALRDAVRGSRGQLEELVRFGSPDTLSRDLDAIAGRLEAALQPEPPPG